MVKKDLETIIEDKIKEIGNDKTLSDAEAYPLTELLEDILTEWRNQNGE